MNKLAKIHAYIKGAVFALILVIIAFAITTMVCSCQDGNPILTKQCKCKVIGETNDTSVVRIKKDYKDQKINIFTPCGNMNKIVADELGVSTVRCENYNE